MLNDIRAVQWVVLSKIESFDDGHRYGRMLTNELYVSNLAAWSSVLESRHSQDEFLGMGTFWVDCNANNSVEAITPEFLDQKVIRRGMCSISSLTDGLLDPLSQEAFGAGLL